jgi:AcrR family transcriptional regulator
MQPIRRAQIIEATKECIAAKGYNTFSVKDIASEAGVSTGIIHYYFKTKHDLMLAVLDELVKEILKAVDQRVAGLTSARAKIEAIIAGSFDFVSKNRKYYHVMIDFWAQVNDKRSVKNVLARVYAEYRRRTARIVEQGITEGVFRRLDPSEAAAAIIALIDGLSIQWIFDPQAIDVDRLKALCRGMVMSYLQRR